MVLPSVFAPAPPVSSLVVRENRDGTVFVSLPLDCATMDNMCYVLELPKYLKELTFIPPRHPPNVPRLEKEISETLVWLFGLSQDLTQLECVVLPLEFLSGVEVIFRSLRKLPALKNLTLTMPAHYDFTSQSFVSGLFYAVEKGIKSLPQLEELTLPAEMVTGTMVALLDHLFDSSVASYDGMAVQYNRSGSYSMLFDIPYALLSMA